MKQYIHLLQEFIAIAGYDTSYLQPGDTDLVNLKEDESLLVIFNKEGYSEDLFMIFDEGGVTITFGDWYEYLHGTDFSTFEYLVEIIHHFFNGDYYVKEMRFDNIEVALLISLETDQIINSCIISGTEELRSMSAFDFFQGLDYSECYINEIFWTDEDPLSEGEQDDTFYFWDEGDADLDDFDDEDAEHEHEHHHHHHDGCSCGHCHE